MSEAGKAPAAPSPEQVAAAQKAEMDSFVRDDLPARDIDPDAATDEAVKPKALPNVATSVEEDNEQAEPALQEADDEEEGEPAADDRPKPKKSVSERIKELTRGRGEAERKASAIEAENASLKARLDALERGEAAPKPAAPKTADKAAPADGKPDPTKFKYGEFDPDYTAARDEWLVSEAEKRFEAKQAKQQEERSVQERTAALEAKRDSMAEAGVAEFGDDYMTTVIQGAIEGKWPVSPIVAELTLESEVGYKIAHHLATHPKEAREVYGKSPVAQAAYFGRLEERFLSTKVAPGRKQPETPNLPDPPRRVARGVGGQYQVTADTADFAAFEAMHKQRNRG